MIYAIVLLIVLGFIVNKLSEKYAFEKLNYFRELSKSLLEPDEVLEIKTVIENKKILPITFLQVTQKFPSAFRFMGKVDTYESKEGVFHRFIITLMPYQRVKRTYRVSIDKRGKHMIYESDISVGDILGLKSFSRPYKEYREVIVLPKRYDIENSLVAYGSYNGDVSVKRWIIEDPILTLGIREYTGYEPQKNIHWPSSLKSGRLMVKNFDYTSDNKALVILNIESYKPFWMNINSDYIEKCISISRTVLEGFEESGVQYGFSTNAKASGAFDGRVNILPGWGGSHLYNIIECLGRIDYGISDDFEEHLEAVVRKNENYSTYVIITPVILDEYIEWINLLGNKCQKLIVISLDDKNLERLDAGIISYLEGGDMN